MQDSNLFRAIGFLSGESGKIRLHFKKACRKREMSWRIKEEEVGYRRENITEKELRANEPMLQSGAHIFPPFAFPSFFHSLCIILSYCCYHCCYQLLCYTYFFHIELESRHGLLALVSGPPAYKRCFPPSSR